MQPTSRFARGVGLETAIALVNFRLRFWVSTSITPRDLGSTGRTRYSGTMTPLSAFGLFAVTAMLITYAFESKSVWYILGFAFACALGSIYGFLQGAWPFGLVEAVWSGVAARRWWLARLAGRSSN